MQKSPIVRMLPVLMFFLYFSSFMTIRVWDFDFWWHISTGREIASTHEIPAKDPFSSTSSTSGKSSPDAGLRERFIMREYWLAQLFFFAVFKTLGPWGIAAVRSSILALTIFLVYAGLRRSSMPILTSLAMTIPIFMVLSHGYIGERPVLFSFLFGILTYLLLERSIETNTRNLFFLPAVMVVWSNVHGGFIIGIVIIITFLGVELGKKVLKRRSLTPHRLTVFSFFSILSIIASLCNPNGYLVARIFFVDYHEVTETVQEYKPLLSSVIENRTIDPAVAIIIMTILVACVLRAHKMRLQSLIILAGVMIMGVLSTRYFAFTATIGMVIAGQELLRFWLDVARKHPQISSGRLPKTVNAALIIIIVFFGIQISAANAREIPHLSKEHIFYPCRNAADFIRKNHIRGNMFNADALGGYLIWELYPSVRVFMDTRELHPAVLADYRTIMSGAAAVAPGGTIAEWERLLKKYGVNFIVIHGINFSGKLLGLMEALLDSPRWAPVFADRNVYIFVENTDAYQEILNAHRLSRENLLTAISVNALQTSRYDPANFFFYETIATVLMKRGDYDGAKKAYLRVLALDAGNPRALAMLRKLDELKKKDDIVENAAKGAVPEP